MGDSKKYKVKAIQDTTIYARKTKGQLLKLYYLILWKSYLKKENTWEPLSEVQYLKRMISVFYKNYPDKPIATSNFVNATSSMGQTTIKPIKSTQPR